MNPTLVISNAAGQPLHKDFLQIWNLEGNAMYPELKNHINLIQDVANVIIVFVNSFDKDENLAAVAKLIKKEQTKVCVVMPTKNDGSDSDSCNAFDSSSDESDTDNRSYSAFKTIEFVNENQNEVISELIAFTSKTLKKTENVKHTFSSIARKMPNFNVDLNSKCFQMIDNTVQKNIKKFEDFVNMANLHFQESRANAVKKNRYISFFTIIFYSIGKKQSRPRQYSNAIGET